MDRRDVLLNAMKLYNGRSKIVNLFEVRNIGPSDFYKMQNLKNQRDRIKTRIRARIRTRMRTRTNKETVVEGVKKGDKEIYLIQKVDNLLKKEVIKKDKD